MDDSILWYVVLKKGIMPTFGSGKGGVKREKWNTPEAGSI